MILTEKELKESREWLADCLFIDVDSESIFEMDDLEIEKAINKHFDGGVENFRNCCACELPEKYDPNFLYPKIYYLGKGVLKDG